MATWCNNLLIFLAVVWAGEVWAQSDPDIIEADFFDLLVPYGKTGSKFDAGFDPQPLKSFDTRVCTAQDYAPAMQNSIDRYNGKKRIGRWGGSAITNIKQGFTSSARHLTKAGRFARVMRVLNPIEAALYPVSIAVTHDRGVQAKILDGLTYEDQMDKWQKWQMHEFARSHGYPIDTPEQRQRLQEDWEIPIVSLYNVANYDTILLGWDSAYQYRAYIPTKTNGPGEYIVNEGITSFGSIDYRCKDRQQFGPGFLTDPRNPGYEENYYRLDARNLYGDALLEYLALMEGTSRSMINSDLEHYISIHIPGHRGPNRIIGVHLKPFQPFH
jgi:hypothetical protein